MKQQIVSFVTAILVFIVTVQNPIVAASINVGQASAALLPPSDKQVDKTLSKVPEIKTQVGEIAYAEQEKVEMRLNAQAEMKEEQEKQEEAAAMKECIKKIQTTDVTRLDLRKPSGLSSTQAEELLKGTGLEGLGKAFVSAEKEHHVNAYYLIAHAAWESSWGKSKISREKNNLFGYMAYDKNPYASAHGFESREDSIAHVAKYVSENYLDENGDYYHGPNLSGMNINYATDQNWKNGIASVIVGLAQKAKKIADSQGV